jgi:hypothetical protein
MGLFTNFILLASTISQHHVPGLQGLSASILGSEEQRLAHQVTAFLDLPVHLLSVHVHISRQLAGPDECRGFTLLEIDDDPLENIGRKIKQ